MTPGDILLFILLSPFLALFIAISVALIGMGIAAAIEAIKEVL